MDGPWFATAYRGKPMGQGIAHGGNRHIAATKATIFHCDAPGILEAQWEGVHSPAEARAVAGWYWDTPHHTQSGPFGSSFAAKSDVRKILGKSVEIELY